MQFLKKEEIRGRITTCIGRRILLLLKQKLQYLPTSESAICGGREGRGFPLSRLAGGSMVGYWPDCLQDEIRKGKMAWQIGGL